MTELKNDPIKQIQTKIKQIISIISKINITSQISKREKLGAINNVIN